MSIESNSKFKKKYFLFKFHSLLIHFMVFYKSIILWQMESSMFATCSSYNCCVTNHLKLIMSEVLAGKT